MRTLTGLHETSSLRLGLGLLEGRRRVATMGRGLEIGIRGEASWALLATGGGSETVDDLQAGVRRLRGGVELTRALSGPRGLTFTPFGAVSTRRDGGAGQTGVGLEVAGGMRVRSGRLQVEAQGRRLVLHSATDYEEQGVSVAASLGAGPYEPGLTLSVRPTWGAPGMGAETLWRDQIYTCMPGAGYDASAIDARLGYGMRLPGGGLLTPFGAYGQRYGSGRRLQVGALVGSMGRMRGALDAPIQLEVSGERYDRPDGNSDHRVGMFGVVNLGGNAPSHGTTTGMEATTIPAAVTEVAGGDVASTEVSTSVNGYVKAAPVAAGRGSSVAPAATPQPPDSGFESSPSVVASAARRDAVEVPPTSSRGPRSAPVSETRNVSGRPAGSHSNRPPMFSALDYAFEVPARRDGHAMAVPLGVVLAQDPDRGPVTYSLTAGDWTRFTVDPSSGAITYLGPDLPGTRRYTLQVTARNTARRTATTTVIVSYRGIDTGRAG